MLDRILWEFARVYFAAQSDHSPGLSTEHGVRPAASFRLSVSDIAASDRAALASMKFVSAKMAYHVAFITLFLNTNLHKPGGSRRAKRAAPRTRRSRRRCADVVDKMSRETFIEVARAIEGGAQLRVEFLSAVYNTVLVEPIQLARNEGDEGNLFVESTTKGWLVLWEPDLSQAAKKAGAVRRAMAAAVKWWPVRRALIAFFQKVAWGSGQLRPRRYWGNLSAGCVHLFSDMDSCQPHIVISLENTVAAAAMSAAGGPQNDGAGVSCGCGGGAKAAQVPRSDKLFRLASRQVGAGCRPPLRSLSSWSHAHAQGPVKIVYFSPTGARRMPVDVSASEAVWIEAEVRRLRDAP